MRKKKEEKVSEGTSLRRQRGLRVQRATDGGSKPRLSRTEQARVFCEAGRASGLTVCTDSLPPPGPHMYEGAWPSGRRNGGLSSSKRGETRRGVCAQRESGAHGAWRGVRVRVSESGRTTPFEVTNARMDSTWLQFTRENMSKKRKRERNGLFLSLPRSRYHLPPELEQNSL